MFKKIITDLGAAVMLTSTESLSVLRVLLMKLTSLASKSVRLHRKVASFKS